MCLKPRKNKGTWTSRSFWGLELSCIWVDTWRCLFFSHTTRTNPEINFFNYIPEKINMEPKVMEVDGRWFSFSIGWFSEFHVPAVNFFGGVRELFQLILLKVQEKTALTARESYYQLSHRKKSLGSLTFHGILVLWKRILVNSLV